MKMRELELQDKAADEDRKDARSKQEGNQKERIEDKKQGKRFESAGNDALGTGLNMNQF